MDYLTLKDGYLLTILLPMYLLISKLMTFFYIYYDNKYARRFVKIALLGFSVVSSIMFYLHIDKYGEYFCFTWCGNIITPLVMFTIMYRKKDKILDDNINIFELPLIVGSIIWGIFLIYIPNSDIFTIIGGNSNYRIDKISTIIFYCYGMVQIIADKPLAIFIRRLTQKDINKFY